MVVAGFVFGAGCDDEEQRAKVEEAVLVGASGRFFADRGELRIDVSPKDEDGNFVGQGLPKKAFSFENVVMTPLDRPGAEVAIAAQVKRVDSVEADPDAALRAVVLFDSSGSMDRNDPQAMGRRLGGTALFDVLGPEDEVAVLDFGAGSTGELQDSRVLQDFTGDRTLLDASLDQLTEQGGTPLYKSILEALDILAARNDTRDPVLVVLTDGAADDNFHFQDAID
jgi:Mg-chelatase subunit ChlD